MPIVNPRAELRAQYQLTRDSYTGQGNFANGGYLYQYEREVDFAQRQDMASYTNFVKPIVDARVNPVFVSEPNRTYDNEIVDLFLKNCDNNETSLTKYIHKATTETVLLGNSFIVMDNFPENEIPETLNQVIEDRKFPYIYSKSVLDVYEYKTDIFNKLEEITFYYGLYEWDGEDEVYLYKRFTKDDIEYFILKEEEDDDGTVKTAKTVISTTVNELGRVPVAYDNKDILPMAPYYSMASLARNMYNTDSELKDLSRSQMFSILLIPSINPTADSQDNIVISNSNAIFYDSQSTNTPEYISPDSSIMTVQMENRSKQIENLLSTADVLGSSVVNKGTSASSGVAMSYEFFGQMYALLESSNIASNLEEQVIEILGLYLDTEIEYYTEYPREFSPTFNETQQKINALNDVVKMNISEEVSIEMNKSIVKLLGEQMEIEPETLTVLVDSVVSLDTEVITDTEVE